MEHGDVPPAGAKRIKSLEDQVERLSEEHTSKTETWRSLSSQVRLLNIGSLLFCSLEK